MLRWWLSIARFTFAARISIASRNERPYTVLLPGEPKELADKVPQALNLNSFPTTFILGRDGRVRAVHAGFPSPGSGSFYEEAEREITGHVERLLAEDLSSS
jgi:hypothetical protein